jgi:DNA-3-methyladenine glycosylase
VRVGRSFFDRPTVAVARALLGATLRVRTPSGWRAVELVEVEAYVAGDPASHAFRGPTRRNRSMFVGPGTLYVYRIHQVVCANLATRPGEAVLLRAGAPVQGPLTNPSGPGRLCRELGISMADDGLDTCRSRRVRIEAGPSVRREGRTIVEGPRIGLSRAVRRRLRFSLAGNPWVSRPWPSGGPTSVSASRRSVGGPSPRSRRRSRPSSAGGRSGDRNGDK